MEALQLINYSNARIEELTLRNRDTLSYRFYNDGQQAIKVTISWTDIPDSTITFTLNDRTPKLVNDLDVRIIDPNGKMFLPYCLDPEQPNTAAFHDDNILDNVEQIPVDYTTNGMYTVVISHKNQLDSVQAFSMIIEGIQSQPDLCFSQTMIYQPEPDSSISGYSTHKVLVTRYTVLGDIKPTFLPNN